MSGASFQALIAAKKPVVLTYVTHLEQAGGTSTQTFTSAAIGTASGDRLVIVGIVIGKDSGTWSANPVSSMTIGGISATQVGSQLLCEGTTTAALAIFAASVPTGTTANIVATLAANGAADIVIWNATGLSSTTASDTKSDNATPFTQSLTVPVGGFGIGLAGGESVTSWTWSNMTERSDAASGIYVASGADTTSTGSISVTATNAAGTRAAMLLASWV